MFFKLYITLATTIILAITFRHRNIVIFIEFTTNHSKHRKLHYLDKEKYLASAKKNNILNYCTLYLKNWMALLQKQLSILPK